MCQNSIRDLLWENATNIDFSPFLITNSPYSFIKESISVRIHLKIVTKPADFEIFSLLKSENMNTRLELRIGNKG
jgi:hypothetical protein